MLPSQIPSYFKNRRDALMKARPGAVFLLPSAEELLRNPDVTFHFRQESYFYYLTGFEEPESFLVLSPRTDQPGYQTTMFVRRKDTEREMWEGERYGVEGAQKVFGADQAFPISELEQKLPELLKSAEDVYYRMGQHENMDRKVQAALETTLRATGRSGRALPTVKDPGEAMSEMRLFKAPEEVEALRKACQITALAHKTAMEETRPGMNEFEIEALIDYTLRRNGCQRVGYGSIIAGGVNAACLHYRFNNQPLQDGDLLLIDAGGEYNYYTSDITRTFPVGRRFSDAQGKAYELVLKSQKAAIAMAKPGATLPAIHKHVCEILTDGMLSLGLLKGGREEIMKANAFRRFYPHNTSHWLGMDVHDVGLYQKNGQPRALEAGMCFTIEPGFYVQPGDTEAPREFRNIGIRIEDDILITRDGCEVLTHDAPKDIADIEALRA